ncbi:MAG TPA: DoxX family protein [Chryseolinea sp.]|nr:DoxX family protein [Chryseolinea sp.]
MAHLLLSPRPLWSNAGLGIIRIVVGLLMAYHGLEIFQPDVMAGYQTWDVIKAMPSPVLMVYIGKGLEFVTGLCFILGIFTRIAALLMAIDLLFICFVVSNGRFYYEDQHPFLFALLALVYFFAGPVIWSLDQRIFK